MLKLIIASILLINLDFSLAGEYFVARDGKLFDANDQEFLIRGINSANAWWDSYGRNFALNSTKTISETGSNTIRIAWLMNPPQPLDLNHLENIIKEAIKYKMIPMVELHDTTCKSDFDVLKRAAQWFATNIWLFNKYKKYILINIGNEWTPWGTNLEYWRDSYKTAINIIRQSGWAGALVIDASACGQNPDGILKYGQELVNSDPSRNLVFSIHTYGEWYGTNGNDGRNIELVLYQLYVKKLTTIIGEFSLKLEYGCDANNNVNWVNLNIWEIMRQCLWKNVGYLGWSWHGNGQGSCNNSLEPLNVVQGSAFDGSTWTQHVYTEWGYNLVNFPSFGIKATSKRCSYFN